jgi:hypothetical protein
MVNFIGVVEEVVQEEGSVVQRMFNVASFAWHKNEV